MRQIGTLRGDFGAVVTGDRGELLGADSEALMGLVRKNGAVLFKGTGATVDDFEQVTFKCSGAFLVHHGTGRDFVNQDGTTGTVAPGFDQIPPHIERAYAPPIPDMVFFYCKTPVSAGSDGGATTIYDGFDIFSTLSPELQRWFVENRMRWKLRVPSELWKRTFQVETREQAEVVIEYYRLAVIKPKYNERVEATFEGEDLLVDFITSPTVHSPRRDGWAFSNSGLSYLDSWMQDEGIELLTEDGKPYPIEPLKEAMACAHSVVVPLRWEAGDFVALDNRTVLHGREAFVDPGRQVYIRMCFADV
jgi:alpha-ketoglutarate-dependent taurine dioxygenase